MVRSRSSAVLDALLVESDDVAQHPEIGGRQQVAGLREQSARGLEPVVAAAFPLEAAGVRRHRKAHAAFDRVDAEMGEQRLQVGIVQFIVDDEADVDRKLSAVIVDADGVAVAAGPEFAVVDGDWIMFRQGPGGGIAADSVPTTAIRIFALHSTLPDTGGCSRSFKSATGAGYAAGRDDAGRQNRGKTEGKPHEILVRFRRSSRVPTSLQAP